jgi:hypothetical protein
MPACAGITEEGGEFVANVEVSNPCREPFDLKQERDSMLSEHIYGLA